MNYVCMTKLGAVENPEMPPGDPTTYPYGRVCETGQSLPADYQLEGWLVIPPAVGRCVEILRCARNGIACPGHYRSTPVTYVRGDVFHTRNSIYRLVEIPELSAEQKCWSVGHPLLFGFKAKPTSPDAPS